MASSKLIRLFLLTAFSIVLIGVCGNCTIAQDGVDKGCSPTVANPCTNGGSGGSSGSGGRTFLDDIGCAIFGGADCPAKPDTRRASGVDLHNKGVEAYDRGDYAAAVRYFEQALKYLPDSEKVKGHLADARARLAEQREGERAAREAEQKRRQAANDEALRKNKAIADNMQNSAQDFAKTLNATPSSSGLDFDASGSTTTAKGSGKEDGLDFTANTDASVVDLRDAKTLVVDPNVVSGKAIRKRASVDPVERSTRIEMMNALAKKLGWSTNEQARLEKAFKDFRSDWGNVDVTVAEEAAVWNTMKARQNDPDLFREASKAGGWFPSAGQQSTNDCTIFALANATGLPYSIVAARAAELISEGEWRDRAERASPNSVFERGLNGDEVTMLAEAFGQAEVISSGLYVDVLRQGRPILLGVTLTWQIGDDLYKKGKHEIVLTKTFEYKGETYFEVMDSNQPANVHNYLKQKELDILIFETGVAFSPEKLTIVKSLK